MAPTIPALPAPTRNDRRLTDEVLASSAGGSWEFRFGMVAPSDVSRGDAMPRSKYRFAGNGYLWSSALSSHSAQA
jgi:hypothetical protein